MYIKIHLTHVDTGIGAINVETFSEQRHKYKTPNFNGITILHEMEDGIVPYFLCTAADDYDITDQPTEAGVVQLSQSEWDAITFPFDANQELLRYNLMREIRNEALEISDVLVIKSVECETSLSQEFKDWRQALRDLPNGDTFPLTFPTPPSEVTDMVDITTNEQYQKSLRSTFMFIDPLPAE